MFLKVITVVFVISMGFAAVPKRNIRLQYAETSQGFHRENKSNEHKARKKPYSPNLKELEQQYLPEQSPKVYPLIQYAPLSEEYLKRHNKNNFKIPTPQQYDKKEINNEEDEVRTTELYDANVNDDYEYERNTPKIHHQKIFQPNYNIIMPLNELSTNNQNPINNYYVPYKRLSQQRDHTMKPSNLIQQPKLTREFTPTQLHLYDYSDIRAENNNHLTTICAKIPRIHLNVGRSFSNFANYPYKAHIQTHDIYAHPKFLALPLRKLSVKEKKRQVFYFLNEYIPYHRS